MAIKKIFSIGFDSANIEKFNYHIDLSVGLTTKELHSLCCIYGINEVREKPMHLCIQTGALIQISPFEMLEQLIAFFETIGFKNNGLMPTEILNNDIGVIPMEIERIRKALERGILSNTRHTHSDDPIFPKEEKKMVDFDFKKANKDLAKAVEDEDYELAAQLRDIIEQAKEELKKNE